MKNKYILIFSLLSITLNLAGCKSVIAQTKFNQDAKMEVFLDSLLQEMTLIEKLGQLNLPSSGDFTTGLVKNSNISQKIREGKVGGLFNIQSVKKIREVQKIAIEQSRLKIPLFFAMDVIHGYKSTFPIPLGSASSWNMELIKKSAQIAAHEASADGINWFFSPMLDLSRDPRWGRIAETYGEDPYLGSQVARAYIQGYQGDDLSKNNTVAACFKHFALYGAPEAGRDYNTVDMSRLKMHNTYFPPYKAAVEEGAATVMTSFNEVDGIPASGNRWLMTEILRNQWGFKGFVVTDYTAINEMINHGMGDLQQVSVLALKAGVDMDMVGEGFLTTLEKSLKEGKITQKEIDIATKRILTLKYRLGLFDNPYKYCDENRANTEIYTTENRNFARRVATESMVLLKNKNGVLPLKKSGTIAIIGPLADNVKNMPGTWSVASDHAKAISLLGGLKKVLGDKVNFLYAQGSNLDYNADFQDRVTPFGKKFNRDNRPKEIILQEATKIANKSDVIVLALGESAEMSGESSSRTNIKISQSQKNLLRTLKQTNKPIVIVLFTGRPLILNEESKLADAILNVWFPGSEAGYAISDVLFGDVNPSGKLPITFPRNVGQIPIYYNFKNTGRPIDSQKPFEKFKSNYLDVPNTPLYPFGYGLSYTTFNYSDLSINKKEFGFDENINVSVTVTNNGKFEGAEIVQLYIQDMVGSITRPVKELKRFKKIILKPSQSQKVTFTLDIDDFSFYNSDMKFQAEVGEFKIYVGTNSQEVLETNLFLK